MYRPGPGAKYIDMPKARYATHHEDTVLKDGRQVGISMDCGYLANERGMVSLADDRHRVSEPGTEVDVVWGEQPVSAKPAVEEHEQVEIRATVAPSPSLTSLGRTTALGDVVPRRTDRPPRPVLGDPSRERVGTRNGPTCPSNVEAPGTDGPGGLDGLR